MIACSCGSTAFQSLWLVRNYSLVLRCARCGAEATYQDVRVDLVPADEQHRKWDTRRCEWMGLCRWEGDWRPVVLAETLDKCWQALLGFDGDLTCVPTKPVHRSTATRVASPGPPAAATARGPGRR